jgi:hypothetical protein
MRGCRRVFSPNFLGFTPPQKIPSAKICWKISSIDFFWDQDGIFLVDYLPKGQTINAEYCSFLLLQLKDILKEKRPGSPGTCNSEELAYLGFRCLDHPP